MSIFKLQSNFTLFGDPNTIQAKPESTGREVVMYVMFKYYE